ncbi:HlyC/CorC family transporter [Sphingomonas sp. AP4-R1]|uniref:hemolysin family protein n=1 Tax=Sphingomonas sp. AP4-R1 TaxID=2735134 RepID=UPI00149330B0|nr:hemolysin family protein [Sphingomonas sp. AP4-R1]QJU56711.1 HlyC/CorC family transporter [Sphingomonas sp. AP4-R1]
MAHPFPWFDLAIIIFLMILNGVFAMSELAIVSARKPRLEALARKGRSGARVALVLASDPGKFLSTVQTGITLIGILAGAYSGASLGGPVGELIGTPLGLDAQTAAQWGFVLVIIGTTYLSLIVGELVPKQFALRQPEAIASIVARPMMWLSRVGAPFVWLLDRSSAFIFRLLRLDREATNHVTAEELHLVVAEASTAGVIDDSERAFISSVVRLADRPVREVMTPRTNVDWIDLDDDADTVREQLLTMQHSRMPVGRGTVDALVGVVQARDLLGASLADTKPAIETLVRTVPVVPDQMDAMDALTVLREADVPMAFVHDEYGHFDGLVTPVDLLAAIAGAFASNNDEETDPPFFEREDGSWLLSGSASADVLADRLCIDLPDDRDYATVAGFALSVLRHLPTTGEVFSEEGWRFEIVDMDGRKIDKLLASRE